MNDYLVTNGWFIKGSEDGGPWEAIGRAGNVAAVVEAAIVLVEHRKGAPRFACSEMSSMATWGAKQNELFRALTGAVEVLTDYEDV